MENEMDEETFERYFHQDFMPASGSCIRGIVEDDKGQIWAFLDYWTSWVHEPLSAVLHVDGDSIEIGVRAKFIEKQTEIKDGDVPIIHYVDWCDITGMSKPVEWGRRMGVYVVNLPFYPKNIKLVDY